ncbi:MAG: GntR family transcriptional regulator [Velocimicrobium sp.]
MINPHYTIHPDDTELFAIPNRQNDKALYLKAYRKLRDLIVTSYYKNGDKLPSEASLANRMGIGRTSLRTALVLLSEDGYIKTFQGKGTYVVYKVEATPNEYPETYMLPLERLCATSSGREISHINVNQFTSDYDSFLDETLKANALPINLFIRNYTLDGNVAILTNVYYCSHLLPDVDFNDFDRTETLLKQIFETKVHYVNSTITPALDSSSRKLNHFDDDNRNFILISSIWYDVNDNPIVFTKDHYNGNYISYKARYLK